MLQRLAAVTVLVPSYSEGTRLFSRRPGLRGRERYSPIANQALGCGRSIARTRARRSCSPFRAMSVSGPASATRREAGSAFSFTRTTSGRITRGCVKRGVSFLETPRSETYGLVAVFVDPWGGKWDLLQPALAPKSHEIRPTRLGRQVLFWGLGLAALLLVVYLLGSTITPFAAGIVLGYLLDPVVVKLQRFGFNRLGASLFILTVFVLSAFSFSFSSFRFWEISSSTSPSTCQAMRCGCRRSP